MSSNRPSEAAGLTYLCCIFGILQYEIRRESLFENLTQG